MLNRRLIGVFKQYGFDVGWLVTLTMIETARGFVVGRSYELPWASVLVFPADLVDSYGNEYDLESPEEAKQKCIALLQEGRFFGTPRWFTLARNNRYDFMIPWVANRVKRLLKDARRQMRFPDRWPSGARPAAERLRERLLSALPSILDWAEAERIDLMGERYTIRRAYAASRIWHEEIIERAEQERLDNTEPPQAGRTVYRWEDGWTVQKLEGSELLKEETRWLAHCVGEGGYEDAEIYSLRDPEGKAYASIEHSTEEDDSYDWTDAWITWIQESLQAFSYPGSYYTSDVGSWAENELLMLALEIDLDSLKRIYGTEAVDIVAERIQDALLEKQRTFTIIKEILMFEDPQSRLASFSGESPPPATTLPIRIDSEGYLVAMEPLRKDHFEWVCRCGLGGQMVHPEPVGWSGSVAPRDAAGWDLLSRCRYQVLVGLEDVAPAWALNIARRMIEWVQEQVEEQNRIEQIKGPLNAIPGIDWREEFPKTKDREFIALRWPEGYERIICPKLAEFFYYYLEITNSDQWNDFEGCVDFVGEGVASWHTFCQPQEGWT